MIIHRINSIYRATEGEGVHIGSSQIFVRYQGCQVGCKNCDSKDTWSFRGGKVLTTEEIIKQCLDLGFGPLRRRVSITGGDPLDSNHLEGLQELIEALKKLNAWINIEAAGNIVNHEIFEAVDFISFDHKTPSTGVKTPKENLLEVIQKYYYKLQVKSVVFDQNDFESATAIKKEICLLTPQVDFPWILTPVYNYGEDFPKDRVGLVIEWNESLGGPFRVISQQHKWIHGSNKKYV
mgnify:CR=1 FL=1